MTMRSLIVSLVLTALAAAPAAATVRKNYTMTAQQQVHTPVGTTVRPAGSWEGKRSRAAFSDNEAGTVTMEEYTIENNYRNEFDASGTTGVPNCFAETVIRSRFSPALPATAAGSINGGTLSFGTLGGWTRAGQIWCFARLYSGTTYIEIMPGFFVGFPIPPVLAEGPPSCTGCDTSAGLVHDGWGNGPPMFSTTYNLDPITFAAGGGSFTVAGAVQTFSTNGGYVNGYIANTTGTSTVVGAPALLPIGVAALGASLTFLGARSLRRRGHSEA